MNLNSKVQVLLASYNGGCFIEEQIESIFSQKDVKVSLVIRDDGSTDNSIEKITKINLKTEDFTILRNEGSIHGHLSNFGALCEFALKGDAEYFAFSDQDDIWHANKLKTCIERLVDIEDEQSSNTPILIHSDLKVVDKNLVEIAPSFIKYQGIPAPQSQSGESFLHQNVATGCTFVFNRALLELASPIPKTVVIHDWWFALVAKYYGVIEYLDKPLIDYRQHGGNSIGALSSDEQRNFFSSHIYRALLRYPRHLSDSIYQAKALELLPKTYITEASGKGLRTFCKLKEVNLLQRCKYVNKVLGKQKPIEEKLYFYVVMFLLPFFREQ
ncbi:glycosyltransferase family 2 protein [Shewanella donghaensis]|uniref:glycosyltransferase family 2 protein n=1 Tax=Shewanella donghaensis TaxID=238836 RepID=UPI001183292E|nr:glycosyltransferase family 2 protein [Shewanella donghaensis]